MTVRDNIFDFLKSELVGPSPGFPCIQLDGEEVLGPDAPPRLRYGAGILFPRTVGLFRQEDDEQAVSEDQGTTPETNEVADSDGTTGEQDVRSDERGDSQGDSDFEINRTNEYLPSAIGVTTLIDVKSPIRLRVTCAQYRPETFKNEGYNSRDGRWVPSKFWFRVPLEQEVVIDSEQLLTETSPFEIQLNTSNAGSRLALHIYSREADPNQTNLSASARFITVSLINRSDEVRSKLDELCFFQCAFEINLEESTSCFIEYPENHGAGHEDEDQRALELLYLHRKNFATGHGCAPDWDEDSNGEVRRVRTTATAQYEIHPIAPASIDGVELCMRQLSDEESDEPIVLCDRLADAYERWIYDQKKYLSDESVVPERLRDIAIANLDQCQTALSRIRRGIHLLRDNSRARQSFSKMNRAMLMQHVHYDLSVNQKRLWEMTGHGLDLDKHLDVPDYNEVRRTWRPFQLAFVLMTLPSMVLQEDDDFKEREIVDLIWFPTGGGKTEAYLGLTAFSIFFRRIENPLNAGTTALMRYTLRLLTTQQFQRAASLICACEVIRREDTEAFGEETISIGLWVGGGVTPNTQKAAVTAHSKLLRGDKENPFIILGCPWCGAQMGPVKAGRRTVVKGYRKLTNPNRISLVCEDPNCAFSSDDGLPLRIIDEDIYENPPTLLVGTVDKFALLPWYPQARALFGLNNSEYDPPDLIIQDELHLISGPLGSMVGHYETLIDVLCNGTRGGKQTSAKIVASTATIARASEQIRALYGGRTGNLFPPQALRAGESFFAEEREDLPGRKYVGIFATGLPSLTTAEVRSLSSVLQAPKSIEVNEPEERDPYWTCMVYFNSIRELGHAATLIRADIPEYMRVLWRRLGLERKWSAGAADTRRFINHDMELTSRVQNSEITDCMEKLFTRYDPKVRDRHPIDVCLATNMIQVGLDVPRLSLMVIVGQPKTTSEYIQASSRVGRSEEGPGLVITLLNPAKPRDRSHFEHFRSFHQSIYRFVEPTSVTPFALPVSQRAIHALVIALARFWGGSNAQYPSAPDPAVEQRIRAVIIDRVNAVEPEENARVERRLNQIFDEWHRLPPERWGGFKGGIDGVPFMYPSGSHADVQWDDRSYETPSSMRNVDANCNAKVISVFPEDESM